MIVELSAGRRMVLVEPLAAACSSLLVVVVVGDGVTSAVEATFEAIVWIEVATVVELGSV